MLSGAPVLKGVACMASIVLDKHEGGLTEAEIADIYTLRLERVQVVIDFAVQHRADQQKT